ncbi:divergent protein kinase domain 2B-like isoform X2 [Tachypleus tridentatus]|uniref:divergent protein kinase domain 2B-like isoform X2 n=1 Tax=Tachypleus tridentatus TaxID=6853 RepID=UPI003FD0319E
MQTLKHFAKMLFRQWYKKLVLAAILGLGLYCSLYLLDNRKQKWKFSKNTQTVHQKSESQDVVEIDPESQIQDNQNMYKVPREDVHLHTCPACFGRDLCTDLESGALELYKNSKTESHNLSWREAVLNKNDKVIVSSAADSSWNRFDQFICNNASKGFPCDVSTGIRASYLASNQLMTADGLRNLHKVLDKSKSEVVLPICATNKLVDELKAAFDGDGDGQLNEEEQAELMTGLLLHPSYVLLKFQDTVNTNFPLPNYQGTCGRLAVWEGGVTPLKDHLQESFEERAGLASQILQLVDDFQNEDPNWYFLYTEFSYNSLSVTKEGEILLTDLQDVTIIDKTLFPPKDLVSGTNERLCNEICFQKFTSDILTSPNVTDVCSQLRHYGQLMYAIVCKEILSDLEEHKMEGLLNYEKNKDQQKSRYSGLLHSPPEKDKENIEEVLRECVQETSAGGRNQAVEDLQDILENYLSYNDLEHENDDGYEEDNNDKESENY